jgi:ABC-2 type transport system permease protein
MTSTYALRDSTTMLRRDLRHLQRYPGLSMFPILMPVVLLVVFVYVFGGTLGDGITVGGGRGAYINFLTPVRCCSPSSAPLRSPRSPWPRT